MFLVFDTETTGLPRNYNAPLTDSDNWPRIVQIAWQLHDQDGQLIESNSVVVKPEGFTIPFTAVQIHHITTEKALEVGIPLADALALFTNALNRAKYACGHNIIFDKNIIGAEMLRLGLEDTMSPYPVIDTAEETTEFCKLPGGKGGKFKYPKLEELHSILFSKSFAEAHNAGFDVEATARCVFECLKRGIITRPDVKIPDSITNYLIETAQEIIGKLEVFELTTKGQQETVVKKEIDLATFNFVHLHNHSQYSVLQSTSDIDDMIKMAAKYNMPGIALTDAGNMYGSFMFWQAADKVNKGIKAHNEAIDKGEKDEPKKNIIKCILGTEIYVTRDRKNKSQQENGYLIPFIAKNKTGYENLIKMSSISYTEGFYYVPRIDREIVLQYKEGVIATTGSLQGEIPSLILNVGETQAEEAFLWWKENFGDNFYVELNRHNTAEEDAVNEVLLRFAKKHDVRYFAANNNYYLDKKQARAHDILLCIKEGEKIETPIGRGRGFRPGLPNDEFYFKSPSEMAALFSDLPEALEETVRICESIEDFKLSRDVLLPNFDIPDEFKDDRDNDPEDELKGKRGENNYLRHLTYSGAVKRYGDPIPDNVKERLDFELATIQRMGFPGYFLIVQDFTTAARDMGTWVGPGRGSAAGSAIAYCLGITNVDPIKYDLLFERFLNPERISMPDIDIDFDDEGRDKVIDYVINKYGKEQVAQIITYGTLGGKSAIRDAARVLDLPLGDADRLAKTFPDSLAATLKGILNPVGIDKKQEEAFNSEQLQKAKEFRKISEGSNLEADTLKQAYEIEGCVRNTGVHACGVIITPDVLTKFVPVATAKDADLLVTQFDNSVAESAGLLKMDFLGLKTLTQIKETCRLIKDRHGIEINPDEIPLEDEKMFKLFQRGETVGIFQFESPGMQKYLKELKPDKFSDLIAMNALYRPGPLEYIPNYIRRKHGLEPIVYDLPGMEEFLQDTYGITVYQEQVMLLSQKLANFTKGEADTLRKAMGKKQRDVLDKMKGKFLEGCASNGLDTTKAEKVWKDWEAFASYAFNKSHSTCYAYLAAQTAYLKANYTAEFMAATLTHNMNNIKDVTFFLEECRRIKLKVLGPDVNESEFHFTVNKNGEIRCGLGAIKGVGAGAVDMMVQERKENGLYNSIFDLCKRVDGKAANKKTLEGLAYAGAFDSFNLPRAAYFHEETEGNSFIAKAIKYGNSIKESANSMQQSLFGDDNSAEIQEPPAPKIEEWPLLYKLNQEKLVVGLFISGHPLNQYERDLKYFIRYRVDDITNDQFKMPGKDLVVAGIVSKAEHKISKSGNPFGSFELEDFHGSVRLTVFGENYLKFKHLMTENTFVVVKGRFEARYNNPAEVEFQVKNMDLLENMRSAMTKNIELIMDVRIVTNEMVDELLGTLGGFKGKTPVKITIVDSVEQLKVDVNSYNVSVTPSNELIDELEKIPLEEIVLNG